MDADIEELEGLEGLEGLVNQYGAGLYRFCCRLTQNKTTADDLYQDTFVKIASNIAKIDRNKNPQSFLFSTSIFIWKSNCRTYGRRQRIAPVADMAEAELQPDGFRIEAAYIKQEQTLFIRQEISAMDDKFKIPLYLFYTAELSINDIAQIMKIPTGTVKSRLNKARSILKKRLEAEGYEA